MTHTSGNLNIISTGSKKPVLMELPVSYPAERQTEDVFLSIPDREYIEEIEKEINTVVAADSCPPVIDAAKCKKCSYFDFCYSNETECQ